MIRLEQNYARKKKRPIGPHMHVQSEHSKIIVTKKQQQTNKKQQQQTKQQQKQKQPGNGEVWNSSEMLITR